MSRKFLVPVLLVAQAVLVLLLATVLARQPAASASGAAAPQDQPQEQLAANGLYLWSYSAKFVCGYQRTATPGQPALGEPIVKPGNYATEINIHNPTYKEVPLRKKFLSLVRAQEAVREPQQTRPVTITRMILGPDFATMDDCNNLWTIIYPGVALPSPMPVFIGYLVILSPLELDVDAVYTANAPGDLATAPTGVSIDVERVTGKRVFVPAGALP
jgi:hypothetical protein